MSERRVIVIGIDGASPELIESWARGGELPTFSKIVEEGAFGRLRSTTPPLTYPAWSSFMTGKNPGQHGCFDFVYRPPDGYMPRPMNASIRKGASIWRLLGAAGKKVGVFNVPATYPVQRVNGYMVAGLPTSYSTENLTYPPYLKHELDEVVGGIYEPIPVGVLHPRGREDAFLEALDRSLDMHVAVFDYLMSRYPADFTMAVFSETDWVQHALWAAMDDEHPQHLPAEESRFGKAILAVYQRIDDYLGRLLNLLDDHTTLIIMSDHGFGALENYIYVNTWLLRNGFIKLQKTPQAIIKRLLFGLGVTPSTLYELIAKIGLSKEIGKNIKRRNSMVVTLLNKLFLSFGDIDWKRTIAYSLGNSGGIYVNLKGREPSGVVDAGSEYEEVVEQLINALRKARHPGTGDPLIGKIFRRDDIYSGPMADRAPDLIIEPFNWSTQPFGDYSFPSRDFVDGGFDGRTGGHRMDGVLIMIGPRIKHGTIQDARIEDLAPTILHLLGLAIPKDMDGQVLKQAFSTDYLKNRPVTFTEPTEDEREKEVILSLEDEQAIEERLSGLGYLA